MAYMRLVLDHVRKSRPWTINPSVRESFDIDFKIFTCFAGSSGNSLPLLYPSCLNEWSDFGSSPTTKKVP